MSVRMPVVAGRFYAGQPERCREELDACFAETPPSSDVAGRPWGGIVPHAGWMCSGAVAGRVVAALAAQRTPATVVIFGAVHVLMGPRAAVYVEGAWMTPLGSIAIDDRLAERVVSADPGLFEADASPHMMEHSIEVQAPFVQRAWPETRLLPIMVPPTDRSHEVGAIVGRACREADIDVVFLGSSDLTHYGPSYGFTPEGVGAAALRWAKDINDRRIIDLMLDMKDDAVTAEAATGRNACGSGAIAAAIAACREMGASQAALLAHTTSHEVLGSRFGDPGNDAVGYAGIVFHEQG
ncbi:MAG: AmmeMemoRadiSam system protein B [Phycisphaerae bacterium]